MHRSRALRFGQGGRPRKLPAALVVLGSAPFAMAVRDVSCAVAGQVDTAGPTGIDQLVLRFND